MTTVINSCRTCKWFLTSKSCHAFINNIPDKIWFGENDHKEKYRGDHGVQYEGITNGDKSA